MTAVPVARKARVPNGRCRYDRANEWTSHAAFNTGFPENMSIPTATTLLWLSSLVLPVLLFLAANRFRNTRTSLIWMSVSVAVGWLLKIAYAVAAHAMALAFASPEHYPAVFAHDGAPHAFAVLFGWVPVTIITALVWR